MRTIHISSAAVSRSLPFLLASVTVFACLPPAFANGVSNVPVTAPVPYFGSFGLGQDGYPQTVSVNSAAQLDLPITPEMLGDLMMIHQRYLAAIQAYQRAPHDSAVVWNKMGIAYQHLYALDFAKLQYEKALQLNPNYPEALNNLGTVLYGEHNYHKSETYYQKAIRLKPDIASFYSNLGTAYFADHNYKRGMEAYRKAFSIDPQVFIGDPLERVAEMGPTEEQIALNYALARLYAQAGMVDASIRYLRLAYIDGFNDNKKLMQDPGFAALRKTEQFRLFLTEERIAPPVAAEQSALRKGKSPL